MDRRRAARVAGVALVVGLLLWAGYAAYVFNLEDVQSNQRTVLLASGEVAPGANTTARVVVTDRATGEPLGETNVTLFLGNGSERRVVGSGETGPDGALAVPFDAPDEAGNHRLSARADSQLGTDEVSARFVVERDYSIVVDTDKPVYQPGQTVHVRTLVRQAGGTPVTDEARVVVTGPEGNRLFSRNVSLSAFGMGSVDFPISSEGRHGRYRVSVEYGSEEQVRIVEVREYRLPQFEVGFRAGESSYRPGETVRATVTPEYFFGEPVRNATVRVEGAGYVGDLEPFGTATANTGPDGVATVDLTLPDYFVGTEQFDGRGLAVLNVSVTDPAGHTETVTREIPVSERDLLVEAVPAGGRLVPGVENTVFLVTSYPDGRPARATVRVGDRVLETNRYGIATYEFVPNGSNSRLRVEARAGGASTRRTVYLNAEEEAVAVQLDAGAYTVGERLSGRVLVGDAGARVYVDATSGGQTLVTRSLEAENGSANFSIDLPPAARGTTEVRAWVVRPDGSVARTTRPVPVRASSDLNVSLTPNRTVYRPGAPASLTVRTSENGSAVPAAVGLDIVDESVFSVEARRAGLARAAFAFEAANEPTLTVYNYSTANLTAPPSDDAERTAQAAVAASLGTADGGVTVDSFREKLREIRGRQAGMREANGYALGALLLVVPLGVLGMGFARRGRGFAREMGEALGSTLVAAVGVGVVVVGLGALVALTNALVSVLLLVLATLTVAVVYLVVERGWSPWGGRGLGRIVAAGTVLLLALVALAFVLSEYLDFDPLVGMLPLLLPLVALLPLVWVADAEEAFSGEQFGRAAVAALAILVCTAPVAAITFGFGATGGAGGGDAGGAEFTTGADGTGGSGSEATGTGGPTEVRQYFPETLASRTVVTGPDGRASVDLRMADSITTWRVSALGATREGTVGSETGSMRVFQPFFVEPDLPVRLTRNDSVTIPVSVFNYGNDTRSVTLELGSGTWYEADSRTANVSVPPNAVRSASFTLRAIDHGQRALTVFAAGRTPDGNVTRDAIRRTVTVDPPGQRLAVTESGAVSGSTRATLPVPEAAYPNTSKTVLRVYPGAFGQTLGGVESLLSMPTGCFEQTSSSLYPNVLALRYLDETGRASPEVRLTAERFIAQGYQRLLTFETNTPGGYSLFGDDPPNLLLTAYGLQEMSDMDEVYDVDPQVLSEMRTYVRDRQNPDGSWPTDGQLEYPLGVRGTETSTTAYVTWSLAHSGADGQAVDDGVAYVRENLDVSSADTMTLAVTLNMLVDADRAPEFQSAVVEELRSRATADGGRVYWSHSNPGAENESGSERADAYRYGEKRVLTTATVTNALVRGDHTANLQSGALRWLVEQKGERGWGSTQNTVMTLRALVNAESGTEADVGGTLTVRANGSVTERVDLSGERGDEVQTFVLPASRGNNSYAVSAPDAKGLYYEFTTSYHIPWDESREVDRAGGLGLNVTWDRTTLAVDDTATVRAEVSPGEGTIGTAIVDLPVPPGFEVESASLERLRERGAVSRYETPGQQVILYLEDVSELRVLEVVYRATQPVEASSGSAEAYDYYNPEDRASTGPETVTVNATTDDET